MLFNKKNIFYSKIYNKIVLLMLSFILFGVLYYLFCDDYEFGGINILQEEMRKSSLKKLVNKIETGKLEKNIEKEISNKIKKGNVDKNLNKKINKEVNNNSIETSNNNSNKTQKIFDRIYFAVVTGTTLGYGDIYPLSNKVKILIIIQLLTTITILFY